ncbi:3-keto-5-aminohexanoate cleavage protein [Polycladidibacter hongkongensis]|uniref:3-keto-5-aminohexanoate cleavage protein n=1 Tax=Polycladidibacter hongkongensis TaxID=1647556 RepID=UPI00083285DE|nr:3-keto-5-aminohexanoate cleavage protein [Pseudovibrio hongkongensis]
MSESLPRILMSAPNGARRGKADHAALPVSIAETVECAAQVRAAGADALHAHVRDANGEHVLDAGLYGELLQELSQQQKDLVVQITTEAVGRYTPQQQAELVQAVMPRAVSVALREMLPEGGDADVGKRFYAFAKEAGIALQHILYAPEDFARLQHLQATGQLPANYGSHLYVLGRYAKDQQSDPADLVGFLHQRSVQADAPAFMTCAFGTMETASIAATMAVGGHGRIGFENSLWNGDGERARDNAQRIAEVAQLRRTMGFSAAYSAEQVLTILGKPV